MTADDYEPTSIRDYVETQTRDETVSHLERIASRFLSGEEYRIWDVWTDQNRWWVINPGTNLYRQEDFQSLEMAFTYHLGVLRVLTARDWQPAKDAVTLGLDAWRKFESAADALDRARDPDDFQAVGMRLREGLLEFTQSLARDDYIKPEDDRPKNADFVAWSELIAEAVAPGRERERLRAHLKGVAKTTWNLVSWLTHARNASRSDAEIAVSACDHLAHSYLTAEVRRIDGPPVACPKCGSYRLAKHTKSDSWDEVVVCEVCDWEEVTRRFDEDEPD